MNEFDIDSEEKLEIAASLLKTNNPNLERLSMNDNSVIDLKSCLRFILPHVGDHLTHLQSVTIFGNHDRVGSEEVNKDIALIIDKQIPCLKKIKIHGLRGGVCGAIAEPLLDNSHIQLLDLSWCGICDEGAEILAGVLQNRQCALTTLYLFGNCIGDRGCCAILDALHHNSSLNVLDFFGNKIGVEGCRAVARALQNKSIALQSLDFGNNYDIDDDGCVCLANALAQNSSLKKLALCGCDISNKGWYAMEQALHKNYSLCELRSGVYHNEQLVRLLALNRERPQQAQATKTGVLPTQLLISSKQHNYSSDACNAEMIAKIISYGNLSVLFSFIQECPSFFYRTHIGHSEYSVW